MDFLSIALFKENLYSFLSFNDYFLVVGKMKIMYDVFIGANKAFKIYFSLLEWLSEDDR